MSAMHTWNTMMCSKSAHLRLVQEQKKIIFMKKQTHFLKEINTLSKKKHKENPTPVVLCVFVMTSLLTKVTSIDRNDVP